MPIENLTRLATGTAQVVNRGWLWKLEVRAVERTTRFLGKREFPLRDNAQRTRRLGTCYPHLAETFASNSTDARVPHPAAEYITIMLHNFFPPGWFASWFRRLFEFTGLLHMTEVAGRDESVSIPET